MERQSDDYLDDRRPQGLLSGMQYKDTTILIVDDEPDVVSALQHFFSSKGFDAVGAFSGEEALCVLAERKVHVILLDIRLPGLRGTEVARFVREKYPEIKLIIITAYPEEGSKLAQETSLDGLLIKPLGVQEVYNKLLHVLEQKDAQSESGTGKRIQARVMLIKAKLLFIEPTAGVFDAISARFRELLWKGENYEMEAADKADDVIAGLSQFQPDILIFNVEHLNSLDIDFIDRISVSHHKPKEIIMYSVSPSGAIDDMELSRLIKTVQAFCLKNGLVEIKWVDI
jgi:CheY-like chemotaxis protein